MRRKVCTITCVRRLSPYETTQIRRYKPSLLQAVEQGEFGDQPVEYITGRVEFAGLLLKVNPAVLIPRIETEEFVERALYTIKKLYRPTRELVIADVGTGSGAIGLSIWFRCQQLGMKKISVYLLDISSHALGLARENFRSLQAKLIDQMQTNNLPRMTTNVSFIQSDLLESLPVGTKVDVLLANLPYIPSSRLSNLDVSVREHEPLLALDGGDDGLRLIQRLLIQAAPVMHKKGVCWLEIDETHTAQRIVAPESFAANNWRVETVADSFGKTRFARCYIASKAQKQTR